MDTIRRLILTVLCFISWFLVGTFDAILTFPMLVIRCFYLAVKTSWATSGLFTKGVEDIINFNIDYPE
jgi:hypothetical protein